ncbi:hypothetical protein A2886_01940 [candidate division WWE3 bacterium RIFCSPHIGHO2_01_FULL_42_13]|uniref:Uncharacterized protein n=1 Tax=candidate division WWE3 bacterium RIFCSPHIGHO2_01_FULL_42_13 TaxID=1802617 RepID=A0A1F4UR50_UNCKA|nr:MAG: hypothetical protein A2886_01940 [candidate division WWE3 bacterium RIFCSPHIGHO2_01_FULL_42_13]
MKQKTFLEIIRAIFTVIAALHVLRIVLNWQAAVGGMEIPIWISYFAILLAGYLAYSAHKLLK